MKCCNLVLYNLYFSPRHSNTGLVSMNVSLTSWGEVVGVGVYIDHPRTPSFPIGLVKTESDFTVRLVETGLGR